MCSSPISFLSTWVTSVFWIVVHSPELVWFDFFLLMACSWNHLIPSLSLLKLNLCQISTMSDKATIFKFMLLLLFQNGTNSTIISYHIYLICNELKFFSSFFHNPNDFFLILTHLTSSEFQDVTTTCKQNQTLKWNHWIIFF